MTQGALQHAASLVGTLEARGLTREMSARLATDPDLAARYAAAHRQYLTERAELGSVEEIEGVSAGGMPDRVKCLHALLGHALAAGPGVNPLGDEVRKALGQWWAPGPASESARRVGSGHPAAPSTRTESRNAATSSAG